jgi:hypothetical protein
MRTTQAVMMTNGMATTALLLMTMWTAACAQPSTQTPTPVLHCQVRYASETVRIDARPVADPYTVPSQDIGGRFRFKAVMVGSGSQVDHIALYAYDMAVRGAPTLIHEVVHKPPFASNPVVPGLTGWNHVYSAYLGREMVYGCALEGAAS